VTKNAAYAIIPKGMKSMTTSLTAQQKKVIISVDRHVKAIFKKGGNEETLLVEMLDFMPAIKTILDVVPKKELELCFSEYDGFYCYIKLLEKLASGIANGDIQVPS
jgi:hypothetical protein